MSLRQSRSSVWGYFKKTNVENKIAACLFCLKEFSYKSTTHNLKCHLKYKHSQQYAEMITMESAKGNIEVKREDDDSSDSGQQTAEILSYFEQETGGRVRCAVCRASCSNNFEDLKNHLKEKHPKLLAANTQDTTAVDLYGNDDEEPYTEVIYLEEDSKKPPKYVFTKGHKSKRTIEQKKSIQQEKERRLSSSSDETPLKRRKRESSNELDTFLTYIGCLLRQMPNAVCAKLQMDIVNLIMKAKLNRSSGNQSNVPETSMSTPKDTTESTEFISTVEIPVNNISSVIDSVDHVYTDAVSDKTDN